MDRRHLKLNPSTIDLFPLPIDLLIKKDRAIRIDKLAD
jgi:hypothetical protein